MEAVTQELQKARADGEAASKERDLLLIEKNDSTRKVDDLLNDKDGPLEGKSAPEGARHARRRISWRRRRRSQSRPERRKALPRQGKSSRKVSVTSHGRCEDGEKEEEREVSGSHPGPSAIPQTFQFPFLCFYPLPFLLYRGLFIKTPVLQLSEETVCLHFSLEQP